MASLVARATLLLLLPACSFGLQQVPASYEADEVPHCTSDSAAPAADLLGAVGVLAVGSFASLARANMRTCDPGAGEPPCPTFDIGIAVLTGVATAVLVTSGVHGIGVLRSCRRAKRAHQDWLGAGKPADLDDVRRQKEQAARAQCDRWRAELAAAKTSDEKLAVARRQPAHCR